MDQYLSAAEKAVQLEQAGKTGKPANIVERMVAGRMHKVTHQWYQSTSGNRQMRGSHSHTIMVTLLRIRH